MDSLTTAELQSACRDRGMRALGMPVDRLKSQLSQVFIQCTHTLAMSSEWFHVPSTQLHCASQRWITSSEMLIFLAASMGTCSLINVIFLLFLLPPSVLPLSPPHPPPKRYRLLFPPPFLPSLSLSLSSPSSPIVVRTSLEPGNPHLSPPPLTCTIPSRGRPTQPCSPGHTLDIAR